VCGHLAIDSQSSGKKRGSRHDTVHPCLVLSKALDLSPGVWSCLSFVRASYVLWSKRRWVSQLPQLYIHAIGSPKKLTTKISARETKRTAHASEVRPILNHNQKWYAAQKPYTRKSLAKSKPPKCRRVNSKLILSRPQNYKKKEVCSHLIYSSYL
jgi:hypothetical protein